MTLKFLVRKIIPGVPRIYPENLETNTRPIPEL